MADKGRPLCGTGCAQVSRTLVRAAARQRWRGWLGAAVLAGGLGGALVGGVAVSRRTEMAYHRFLAATSAFDVLFTNGGTTATNVNAQFEAAEVAARPEVAAIAVVQYDFPSGEAGRPVGPSDLTPLASADGAFGRTLNAARPVAGRLPAGEHEVALTLAAAGSLHLEIGDTLDLALTGPRARSAGRAGTRAVRGRRCRRDARRVPSGHRRPSATHPAVVRLRRRPPRCRRGLRRPAAGRSRCGGGFPGRARSSRWW